MKIFGMYVAFQIFCCFFGPIMAVLAPVIFLWIYWQAKQECQ